MDSSHSAMAEIGGRQLRPIQQCPAQVGDGIWIALPPEVPSRNTSLEGQQMLRDSHPDMLTAFIGFLIDCYFGATGLLCYSTSCELSASVYRFLARTALPTNNLVLRPDHNSPYPGRCAWIVGHSYKAVD